VLLSNDIPDRPGAGATPLTAAPRGLIAFGPEYAQGFGLLTFDGEIAVEHENYDSDNVSFAVASSARTTVSATPRLRWIQDIGGRRNETVTGLDYYDGRVSDVDRHPSGDTASRQQASAAGMRRTSRTVKSLFSPSEHANSG